MNPARFRQRLLLKFAFYFLLTVACYGSLFLIRHPAAFTVAFILYGFSSLLFAFNFSHDCSHNAVFRKKRTNHFAFICIYTLVGAHAEAWKHRHIHSHHYAPNVKEYDTDLQISGLIRVIPDSEHRWYHRFQHWYAPFAYMTYSLFWVFVKDLIMLFSPTAETPPKTVRYHFSFWIQKIIYLTYLLVLPLLFSEQEWSIVLIAFLLMHFTQSLFLLFTFFMTHHVESTTYPSTSADGIIHTSWIMNQIGSSNDMHPFSKSANFILGGFNNHIAHHLFPHINHIYYPELNRILYRILEENAVIPNQTSYWGGIVSHLRLLHSLSRNAG